MREFRYDVGGTSYRVKALRTGADLWLHVNGQTYFVAGTTGTVPKTAKSGGIDLGGAILAPMPGKILKIHVKKADSVRSKQVVVVMEAMKMEYSLAAAEDGLAEKVLVKEGQIVDLHQELVMIKANKG